jgi:hypothetical protein
MGKADQGKWAEDKVRQWLKKYSEAHASFTFNRILDARSARGAMSNPQPGDFQWFMRGTYTLHPHKLGVQFQPIQGIPFTRNGVIEVKSVEHTHRLPYGNFTVEQVGRMRVRAMAGSEPLILVAFRPKNHVPYWRTAPLEYFERREGKGSWDMDGIDAYTHCDDILEGALK